MHSPVSSLLRPHRLCVSSVRQDTRVLKARASQEHESETGAFYDSQMSLSLYIQFDFPLMVHVDSKGRPKTIPQVAQVVPVTMGSETCLGSRNREGWSFSLLCRCGKSIVEDGIRLCKNSNTLLSLKTRLKNVTLGFTFLLHIHCVAYSHFCACHCVCSEGGGQGQKSRGF